MLSSLYTSSDVNILVIVLCYWIARDVVFNSIGSWDDCPCTANKVRIRIERMISFWRKKLNVPILTWFVYYVQKFEHVNVFIETISIYALFFFLSHQTYVVKKSLPCSVQKNEICHLKDISKMKNYPLTNPLVLFVDLLRNNSFGRRLSCTIYIYSCSQRYVHRM